MPMRITMTQTRMGEAGSLLVSGSTYTVSDKFGQEMVGYRYATDTDGVLSFPKATGRQNLLYDPLSQSAVSGDGTPFGSSLIYQSAVPVTAPNDLNNNVLLSVTIPPLRANSRIRAVMMWSRTNNANAHRIKCRFGGSAYYFDAGLASVASGIIPVDIINRGATNSQIGTPINVNTTQNFGTGTQTTSAIDTSTSQLLTFECAKVTTAADSVILEAAWVEVFW